MNNLTGREIQVLELVQNRLLNKNIASELDISVKTVEFHITNAYRKLNIKNRFQLENNEIINKNLGKPRKIQPPA